MRLFHFSPVALAVMFAALSGCAKQHDCQSSCSKLFGNTDGQCAIQVPGHTDANGQSDMINTCENHCQQAMAQAGEVGDYDPNVRSSGNEDVGLDNMAQVALWMDCIEETDCGDLKDNYCAPTTNYPN
ncbi:MAG: hypothetical protein EXR69_15120 [Myxococcales bacterium]|nr:hypothetical protein [Myxococcales bacterium]